MAPRKKAVHPEQPTKAPEGKAPEPLIAVPKSKHKKFVAIHATMWHPFANVYIPTGPPGIILEEPDSWLESQIGAGLIKEL